MSASLPGNRWDLLEPPPVAGTTATRRVSICIPVRDGGDRFARTLAALTALDHPPALTEIVVVDDGSARPVPRPVGFDPAVDVIVHRRDGDGGFGASAARNAAAAQATGEILLFLDADVIASPRLVAAMVRWFDVCDHAAVLGAMRFVDVDDVAAPDLPDAFRDGSFRATAARARIPGQEWRAGAVAETQGLTVDDADLYRLVTGAALAVRRDRFLAVGGFREIALRGIGDTEFGYRLLTDGAVLVPEPEAVAWHQGPATLRGARARDHDDARAPVLARLIPIDPRRHAATEGPVDAPFVPQARVTVIAGVGDDRAARALERIAALCGAEVEVGVAATIEPPREPTPAFAHVWITPDVEWGAATLPRLVDLLSRPDVGCVRVPGADGPALVAATTRGLRRVARDGPDDSAIERVAAAFGPFWSAATALDLRRIDDASEVDRVGLRDRLRVRVARGLARLGRIGRAERRRRRAGLVG